MIERRRDWQQDTLSGSGFQREVYACPEGILNGIRGSRMKFFCTASERIGTCYYEFQKGRWDGHTFWKEDSLLLHDDVYMKLGLDKLFKKAISVYDAYAHTEVNKDQWQKVCEIAGELGGEVKLAIGEADVWVKENFVREEVFTIVGI